MMCNSHLDITAIAYDKRGRALSVGRNSYVKTHPLQLKYAKKTGLRNKIYIHAELSALIKAKTKVHRLVVFKVLKTGEYAPVNPCPICSLAIKEFGVKVVETLSS